MYLRKTTIHVGKDTVGIYIYITFLLFAPESFWSTQAQSSRPRHAFCFLVFEAGASPPMLPPKTSGSVAGPYERIKGWWLRIPLTRPASSWGGVGIEGWFLVGGIILNGQLTENIYKLCTDIYICVHGQIEISVNRLV